MHTKKNRYRNSNKQQKQRQRKKERGCKRRFQKQLGVSKRPNISQAVAAADADGGGKNPLPFLIRFDNPLNFIFLLLQLREGKDR